MLSVLTLSSAFRVSSRVSAESHTAKLGSLALTRNKCTRELELHNVRAQVVFILNVLWCLTPSAAIVPTFARGL